MGWNVRLQDERGKPEVPADAVIEFESIPEGISFRLLKYIDPYGNTYFNQLQMDDFLVDWNSFQPLPEEQEQWELVRDMALRCRNEVHLYLRFVGD